MTLSYITIPPSLFSPNRINYFKEQQSMVSAMFVWCRYLGDGEQDGVAVRWKGQPHVQGLVQAARSQDSRVNDVCRKNRPWLLIYKDLI